MCWNFSVTAKVCRDGELLKEEMPVWTRKAIEGIWQLEDIEASNAHTKNMR